jgi:hypothetical protein
LRRTRVSASVLLLQRSGIARRRLVVLPQADTQPGDGTMQPARPLHTSLLAGGAGGSPTTLYFTEAINGERDGLFGALSPVPEPSSIALLGVAVGVLGLAARKRYQG